MHDLSDKKLFQKFLVNYVGNNGDRINMVNLKIIIS